jgi:hypothetical protein
LEILGEAILMKNGDVPSISEEKTSVNLKRFGLKNPSVTL